MLKGWKKSSRFLIQNVFLPANIDLYPTFLEVRKKLNISMVPIFENLTHLLPLDAPSLVS
jgi:hypothetical protein